MDERFDQGRQVKHHRPDLAAHRGVLLHVGLDDGGVGTSLQGLEHRHGRVHAVGAGDVAAGGHHAPVASPDDHGNVAQLRAVAFLDSGVEGVAVEMGDGEAMKFLVPHDASRAAGRAGLGVGGRPIATVAAQGIHGTIIAPVPSVYSIGHPKRWPGPFPLQDSSLLAEGKKFCVGRRTTNEEFAEDGGGFDDLMPAGKGV